MTAGDVTVDVCRFGCGGMWFDQFELRKVDEPHESAGESLLEVERDETVRVDHSAKRMCPKCAGMTMMKHFFSPQREVEVDECPNCAGFWLDHGELSKIRTQFSSEQERKQAAGQYFADVFGDRLAEMAQESQEQREKAGTIANLFRFLCPSYYLPGKQDWAAF